MQRSRQLLLIASTLLSCWLGMQTVHELGHVLGAWATGATVTRVVLSPATISRTDVSQNSHPLIVVWSGPIAGVLIPLGLWSVAEAVRLTGAFVFRFFAAFCLVANGLYIGVGSFNHIGDCGEMLRHGSASWQLWLFGFLTAPFGLSLWHGQGPSFGLGTARGQVSGKVTLATFIVSIALLTLASAVGG